MLEDRRADSTKKVDLRKVVVAKPKEPKILPESIEWAKKGKDATCS